jgi:hypothetical protein
MSMDKLDTDELEDQERRWQERGERYGAMLRNTKAQIDALREQERRLLAECLDCATQASVMRLHLKDRSRAVA